MYETKIVEALAKDMKVEPVLAKERIRKLRDKGFLSVAGRGNAGEGEITKRAIEILIEKGLIK
jgi:Mn-dependent DtxR family transcriptional regulator